MIFVVLLVAIFYFLIIRPQRRQQKRHQELMQELKRGDKVITTGGIYGVVESLSEDSVVLKIESGATIRIARASIAGQRQEK
ncbi:MAG: preprotein translocase subunit YajC [Chloroflexi bacterium]|nr:preprotein translocase subunit YajC [Chloroflexota bacterium]